jgi:putative peptide zinc metalloprotease protein
MTGAQAAAAAPSMMQHRPTLSLFLYGIASSVWQMGTMLGLAIFAIAAYEGLGVIVALIIGVPMLLGPITKIGTWFLRDKIPLKSRLRAAGLLAGACIFLAWISLSAPWPEKMRSAGFVEFSDVAVLRAVSPGNIALLHVVDGQKVEAGQVIATLENAELVAKAERYADDAEMTALRARGHLHQQRLSDYLTEHALSDSREQAVEESRRKVEALVIHSPIAGVVMARRLEDLSEKYLKEGDELCKVAQGQVEIRLSVAQRDMERFQARIGKTVSVRLPSGTVEGVVLSLDPMGSLSALDPTLLAPMGGPLAAKAKSDSDSKSESKEAWTLPEPHFLAKVRVDNDALPAGFAGQRAEVSFLAWDRTIAGRISDFLQLRFQQARASQSR